MSRDFTPVFRSSFTPQPVGNLKASVVDANFAGVAAVANNASKTFIAADAAGRLAIPIDQIQVRDTCLQLDTAAYYVLKLADPSISGNWVQVSGGGGGGMTNPMTTAGDMILGLAAGAPGRLPIGSNGQALRIVAGDPAWTSPNYGGVLASYGAPLNGTVGGTTPVMAGLAGSFTPQYTGILRITVDCNFNNSTSLYGVVVECAMGTGVAPAANAAIPGTVVASIGELRLLNIPAGQFSSGSFTGIIDTLTPGTTYWIDLEATIQTAAGTTAGGAQITIDELT